MNESILESKRLQKKFKKVVKEFIVFSEQLKKEKGLKISNCGKYFMLENQAFLMESGLPVKKDLLLERTWGEWFGDTAQGVASVSAIFLPGAGTLIETVNSIVYFWRAADTNEVERKGMLNAMGFTSLIVSAFPTILGAAGALLKGIFTGAVSLGVRAITPLKNLLSAIRQYLPKIKIVVEKASKSTSASKILPKGILSRIGSIIDRAYLSAKAFIEKILLKISGKGVAKATSKMSQILSKNRIALRKFVGKGGGIKNPAGFLQKFGFKVGSKIPYNLKGQNVVAEIAEIKGSLVSLKINGAIVKTNVGGFMNNLVENPVLKTYWDKVATGAVKYFGARFLAGIVFDNPDNPEQMDFDKTLADLNSEEVSKELLDAAGLDAEVAGYEGDTQTYTQKTGVSAIQQSLETLGFSVGAQGVDGKFGPDTQAAIKEFQGNNGLPEDGKMSQKLVMNIALALVKADKISEAKTFVGNADFSKFNANLVKALQGTDKNTILKNLSSQGGAAIAPEKKGFMDKFF